MKSFEMKSIGRLILLIVLSTTAAGSTVFAQAAGGVPRTVDQASQVTEFEVNGLKVLVKRRPSAQTVTAGLFIRGGVRNIDSKTAGVEGLMISAAVEAGKKFPRDVVRRELARTGSSIGGSPAKDFSVISLAATRQNFDRIWEIFADVSLNPVFAAADVERVREQTLTGLREAETNPDNFLEVLEERVVYAGHPYANDPSGTLETIAALTVQNLRDHHKKVMQTSQLMLVFVGDLDPEMIKQRVEATFGKLPRGNYKETPYPALDFSKPSLEIVQRDLPTNYVRGVFNAPPPGSPDYYAMRVAISLLQSRIYQEVRVKRQLSYAPNAEIGNASVNTANIYVTAVDANQAVSVMLQEINNLKTRLVANQEISGVTGYFLTTYYIGEETNAAQGGSLARYELNGGGWRQTYEFLDKIREVKDTDIRRVAQKYMNNFRFVVIGNPAAINRSIFLGR
ncbi:MAG: insulinase family protein [Acidobacteria bacterium]|nr:insulinase family protein [Acidobacteriota bacterium]